MQRQICWARSITWLAERLRDEKNRWGDSSLTETNARFP